MSPDHEVVWLTDERHYAVLVERHAYHSLVRYSRGGYDFEVMIANDEYEYTGEDDRDEQE